MLQSVLLGHGQSRIKRAQGVLAAGTIDIANCDVRIDDLLIPVHRVRAGTPGHLTASIPGGVGGDNVTVRVTSSNALDTSQIDVFAIPLPDLSLIGSRGKIRDGNNYAMSVGLGTLVAGTLALANIEVFTDVLLAWRAQVIGAAPGFLSAAPTVQGVNGTITWTSSNGADVDRVGVLALPADGFNPGRADENNHRRIYVIEGDLAAGTVDIANVHAPTGAWLLPFRRDQGAAPGFLAAAVQVANPGFGGTVRVTSSSAGDNARVRCLVIDPS